MAGGECLDASIGRVKGLVLRYSERGLKRTSKRLDRQWPVCGGNVRGKRGLVEDARRRSLKGSGSRAPLDKNRVSRQSAQLGQRNTVAGPETKG